MAGGNSKDIIIRFKGENLLGPTIGGLQKQLNDLDKDRRKLAAPAGFGTVGAALGAEYKKKFDVIRASEERALKLKQFYGRKDEQLQAQRARMLSRAGRIGGAAGLAATTIGHLAGDSSIGRMAGTVGNIAGSAALGAQAGGAPGAIFGATIAALGELNSALQGSAQSAKDFKAAMHESRQRFMASEGQKRVDRVAGLRETQRQLFGHGAEAGEQKPLFGGIFGMVGGDRAAQEEQFRVGMAKARDERSKLQKDMSPAEQNWKRSQMVAQGLQREIKEGGVNDTTFGGRFMTSSAIKALTFGWSASGKSTDEAIAAQQAAASVTLGNDMKRLRRDYDGNTGDINQLVGRRQWQRRMAIGADVVGGFGNALMQAPGAIGAQLTPFANRLGFGASQLASRFAANRELIDGAKSPAERLKDELGVLQGQLGSGAINQQAFGARRRQLLLEGIGQLPDRRSDAPGLNAAEGRFITRGRDTQQSELSALRREAREHARKNEAALEKLITAVVGSGDAGGL